ncbi:MAG: DNA alkylation repair protein [Planctomycetes bacterium]|nr:DNA alkylation repair protein [Planctomycetota bacterium]
MAEPFKNWINDSVAEWLGARVLDVWPAFSVQAYAGSYQGRLQALELKARAQLVGECLRKALPADMGQALTILTDAICATPEVTVDDMQGGWPMFPINSLVATYGLDHPELSLILLFEVTKRFTSEFGIRPFLEQHTELTLDQLHIWASDENVHVRRLVSEGSRPRLPWAPQIKAFMVDPAPVFELLEKLKDDPEEYVRRSVANNLNDICKDHPAAMLQVVEAWSKDASPERKKLIRHACRTLIKAGDPKCLEILGFAPPELDEVQMVLSTDKLTLGEKLSIELQLLSTCNSTQDLIVDYRFHWIKANGKPSARVHKGSQVALAAGDRRTIKHTFHIKPITTRRYYSGRTLVELLINGQKIASGEFHMLVPDSE